MIVWLASYPRSGNTFLRVVLNSVFGLDAYALYDERPEVDPASPVVPPLEPANDPVVGHPFDVTRFASRSELHVVKTHGLPTDSRPAIYIIREGREATASYFHYHRDVLRRPLPLRDIIVGRAGFGSWGRHVALWQPMTRPDTLLLRFEELTADPIAHIERIGAFLGIEPVARQVPTFEELHRTAPKFFRSGRRDSWKSLFSEEENELFLDLHGDELAAFGYESSSPSYSLRRRTKRLAVRIAEATRPITDSGRIAARQFVARLAGPSPIRRAA